VGLSSLSQSGGSQASFGFCMRMHLWVTKTNSIWICKVYAFSESQKTGTLIVKLYYGGNYIVNNITIVALVLIVALVYLNSYYNCIGATIISYIIWPHIRNLVPITININDSISICVKSEGGSWGIDSWIKKWSQWRYQNGRMPQNTDVLCEM
jgi:hypothetical protein